MFISVKVAYEIGSQSCVVNHSSRNQCV